MWVKIPLIAIIQYLFQDFSRLLYGKCFKIDLKAPPCSEKLTLSEEEMYQTQATTFTLSLSLS